MPVSLAAECVQREVALNVSSGACNAEVAAESFMSEATVEA
jgi:DNA-binding NarL/FixJ family response regulator